jgi:hypothetical protein
MVGFHSGCRIRRNQMDCSVEGASIRGGVVCYPFPTCFWISGEMISSEAEHSSRELSAYSQCLSFAPSLRSSAISWRAIFNSAFIRSHQTSKNASLFSWIIWHIQTVNGRSSNPRKNAVKNDNLLLRGNPALIETRVGSRSLTVRTLLFVLVANGRLPFGESESCSSHERGRD